MQIRIFLKNQLIEEVLDGHGSLSIGSSPEDDVQVLACGLVPGHAVFVREGGGWNLSGAGEILSRGKRIREERISGVQTYVLNKEQRVAMAVFEPGNEKRVALPQGTASLTIGRSADNTVVIDSQPVSRVHVKIIKEGNAYYIEDAGSSVGTFADHQEITGKQLLKEGQNIAMGHVTLRKEGNALVVVPPFGVTCTVKESANAVPKRGTTPSKVNMPVTKSSADEKKDKKEVVYQRSPRLKQSVPKVTVEIESPPNIGGKPEINWVSTLLPALVTLIGAAASSMLNPLLSIPMALVGIVVTVSNYKGQVKKYEESQKARLNKYTEHLEHETRKIEAVQKQQVQALTYTDPDTDRCFDVVKNLDRTLWDRRPVDEDFGAVRIGCGAVKSAAEIKIPKVGISLEEDELRDRPAQIKKQYAYVKDVPITCNIKEQHICGIVGSRGDALYLLRNMLTQFVVHHSYTETRIVCIYDRNDEDYLGWVNDLPHALDEERENAFAAMNKKGADELFNAFTDVLKDRDMALQSDKSYGAAPAMLPYLLFVIAQPAFLERDHRIHSYLLQRNDLGAGVIMVAEDITQLPKECNLIIRLTGREGEMFDKNDATHSQKFVVDHVSVSRYATFGKRFRHIVCEEPGKAASLPKKFSFYEMQGISDISEWDLMREYQKSDVTKSMGAPMGLKEGEKLLMLDMLDHENAHGPHGLVAGTTGSGKSEVMLSYLLSLALRFAPTEVSFMIIDFKGGGMANQLEALPHLAGVITNIDEGEINRSLTSIEAELLRRQRLFAAAKVSNIDGYIRAFKERRVTNPLPHLIIVVDEFAELKASHPEFMAKLISAARIGRSLGVHLILATQKPSGQVSEDIWSNSRFQICLRVASREDSNEVIKSPLAFNIREPGRAYLRVGNNEVFELFQSGYSGVKTVNGKTQLEEVTAYIASCCAENGIGRIPPIFLPPLPEVIDYTALDPENKEEGRIAIGRYDDPENQYQGDLLLDVFTRNTFILGSALTGKTNLLQGMIRMIADRYTPQEANIYILDFASKVLKIFETLPHVGGVVTSMEDEKLKNLFKLLNTEIDDRQRRFQELGVSSFNAYLEAGKTDKARIVVIIDNLTALRELYFVDNDLLLPICQNGLAYGISVIAANSQTAGVGYKYMANFANRLSLFCNDSGEYSTVFDAHCTMRIPNLPGRCIVDLEKKLYQAQIYLAYAGEKEVDRAQNIRAWIADRKTNCIGRAVPIPVIPEKLSEQTLLDTFADLMKQKGTVILGLDYETVSPVEMDLSTIGFFGLAAKEAKDCRELIQLLLHTEYQIHGDHASFYIGDGISQNMKDLMEEPGVVSYEYLPAKIPELVKTVEQTLAARYQALMSGKVNLADEKLLVLVLAGNTSFDALAGDPSALTAYKNITSRYKTLKVCVILSELENAVINFSSGDVLKKVRDEQKLFWFGELEGLKILDVPYSAAKRFKKALTEGDCYFIAGSDVKKLKTPTA